MEFINCLRHPEYKTCYLYLLPDNVEILCDYCLEDNVIKREIFQINKLIHINALIKTPEIIFKKLELNSFIQGALQSNINYNSNNTNQQLKEVEKLIQDIQAQIQNMLNEFQECVKNIEILQNQFLVDVKQRFNLDQLKQLLTGLVQSTDTTNPDIIGQLKQKFHQYIQQFQGVNTKEISQFISNNTFETSNSVNAEILKLQSLDQLKMKIERFQNDRYLIATKIFPEITKPIQSTLLSDYQQFKIVDLIKYRMNCDIKEIKLIYLGTRDGLNGQSFWAKINGKKNLLMIFQSKSNYIFGGYTSCQWLQNLSNYVQDYTNSSFLFSQTHDEIYPIVNIQYAIYCRPDCGPTFGLGNDIFIETDFQGGLSNLGHSYKWDKYQKQQSTHLFGQSTPNIIECEIFEITAQ